MTVTAAVPAFAAPNNEPGEDTIILPINDSEAGGTYDQDFVQAYAGATPDGTPVYIYVPAGTPLDGSAPTGVASLDPAFDPTARTTSSSRAPTPAPRTSRSRRPRSTTWATSCRTRSWRSTKSTTA